MKKKILILVFILMLFPCLVNAEDVKGCTVVSGDGSNIGDEVACGTEHFYVLSNDGEEIKMLSKYNLYVGVTFDKVEFNQVFDNASDVNKYWDENYSDDYVTYTRLLSNSDGYYAALAYKYIEYDEVKQSSDAIGAHGDLKVEPLFPEVAVYHYGYTPTYDSFYDNYIYRTWYNYNYRRTEDENYFEVVSHNVGYLEIDVDLYSEREAYLVDYFVGYDEYLDAQGVEVSNMTILSVADVNNLVYEIKGDELPLTDWWNGDWGEASTDINGDYFIVGSIKDVLGDDYSWLWSTTYWTRTTNVNNEYQLFFIDTMGDLCNAEFCSVAVGAGVRPVVTMSSDNLIYNVETKTDGNGTVVANKVQGVAGEEVEFTVEAMSGYQLKKVVVTTSTGQVLEFTDYKFTMPNTNVEIYAEFEKIENPNTGLSNPFIICGSILGIALVGSLIVKKKKFM